jgi:hypothetical protein
MADSRQQIEKAKYLTNTDTLNKVISRSPLGGCVTIARIRGEAVGFQRFRMRVF